MSCDQTELRDAGTAQSEHRCSGQFYQPNVDVRENINELLLVADVPGVNGGDIDIKLDEDSLIIHAKAKSRQSADTNYLLQEFGVGDYYRVFKLSEQVDASRISADYHDGVLTLHLPKVEQAKPRKIVVQAC